MLFPLERGPGPLPHQASLLGFRLFLGAAASQQGPASCSFQAWALGPLQLLPPFPGLGSWRNSWSPLACGPATGPWGETLPSLSARQVGGTPSPGSRWTYFCWDFRSC